MTLHFPYKLLGIFTLGVLGAGISMPAEAALIVRSPTSIWPGGVVTYWLPPSEFPKDDSLPELIRLAVDSWNSQIGCAIRFQEDSDPKRPGPRSLRWRKTASYETPRASLGFQPFGPNEIALGPTCKSIPCILHMMAHVAGLGHEHQRCDKPPFVEIRPASRGAMEPYTFSSAASVLATDVLEDDMRPACSSFLLESQGDYDFASITHYSSNETFAPLTLSQPRWTVTQRGELRLRVQGLSSFEVGIRALSAGDTKALQHLYRNTATCGPIWSCPLRLTPGRPYIRPSDPEACNGGGSFDAWRGNHRHAALDLETELGRDVLAIHSGVVRISMPNFGGHGQAVVLDHGDGLFSVYAHLSARSVSQKERVNAGQLIGQVGYSGNAGGLLTCGRPPHLHLEIIYAAHPRPKTNWSDFPLRQLEGFGSGWAGEYCKFSRNELWDLANACLGELPIADRLAGPSDWLAGTLNPSVILGEFGCWDPQPKEMIMKCDPLKSKCRCVQGTGGKFYPACD